MLSNFPTEELKIFKKDGQVIEGVTALVSSNKIHTEYGQLAIEDGDIYERTLPSGVIERYLIIDSGFKKGMGGHIPDHYQSKVEKITDLPKEDKSPSYISVTSQNGNVNINSTDNSINIRVSEDHSKLFNELRGVISENAELLAIVEEMEASTNSPSFIEKYQKFIASAADHMTIIAPFLPALATIATQVSK